METIESIVDETRTTGATEIAVACPYCFVMLDDGVKELGRGDDVAVKDLAMLLAEGLAGTGDD